jgi:hypothetical protein
MFFVKVYQCPRVCPNQLFSGHPSLLAMVIDEVEQIGVFPGQLEDFKVGVQLNILIRTKVPYLRYFSLLFNLVFDRFLILRWTPCRYVHLVTFFREKWFIFL